MATMALSRVARDDDVFSKRGEIEQQHFYFAICDRDVRRKKTRNNILACTQHAH